MIERDFRHLALIMTRAMNDCKWHAKTRRDLCEGSILVPNPIVAQRIEARLEILLGTLEADWLEEIAPGAPA